MTAAIISLLNVLTKPIAEVSAPDAKSSKEEAFQAALLANRDALLEQLHNDNTLKDVRKLREEVMTGESWFLNDTEDMIWSFVQECLLMLLTLARQISADLQLFKLTPSISRAKLHTPEMAPPLPPDVLSVTQQKTLGSVLQFVVSLGLCPYLAPGVGVPLGHRSAFGAMVEKMICGQTSCVAHHRLLTTTKVLLHLAELSSLATLVFTRHLGDVMAALCQLGYQPQQSEGTTSKDVKDRSQEERGTCQEALKHLLGKVYQPVVIKELLILQGGAKQPGSVRRSSASKDRTASSWLRRLCGHLLSERLMQPNGVRAVVRAILEGGTGGESDWKKCDGIARILAACPQQSASADAYYKQICSQILELLHLKDKLTAQQFQRVATSTTLYLVQEKPNFAESYLLVPLLDPLHRCITAADNTCQIVVEEWELMQCVEDINKIWVVGNRSSTLLLKTLEEVLPVVFTIFCFTKQNVSNLRAPCCEILLWYISHVETSAALSVLRQLSGLQVHSDVAPGFHFTPGSSGGVQLSCRDGCSDEDNTLYEKLSGEQWRLECLMNLLAQLKDNDLPGDFFLDLLQELTRWTTAGAEEEEEDRQQLDISTMTLLEVEQQQQSRVARQGHMLALLQVLAVMVESLPHTVLMRKNIQVVGFIVSLLQRASVGLDQAKVLSIGNPIESQTLTMGMGLLATLLSEPQLPVEVYSSMSRLLQPLGILTQKHPDVFIQELASNLRAVIATHGAYRPDNLSNSAAPDPKDSVMSPKSYAPCKNKATNNIHINSNTRQPASFGDSATSETSPPSKGLSDLLLEACDPDIPTKAFALRTLTQKVQSKDPETLHDLEKVLILFLENLENEDSFIYLSAIQGLASLADSYPEKILERLLRDFQHGPSHSTSNMEHSLEFRLKMGEVLMRASRAMGDLAPHLGHPLVAVFLRGTRDSDPSVRASSLSNLGELCQRLEYALGPLAEELSSCLTALIKTEKEAEVRRAAVHVITVLIRGLRHKTTQVLSDVLLDLYRALKWVVRSDPDEVAVLHAQLALEELDAVMRSLIFPKQKLEKKIVVLP
uniref:transport and Golgi organization protein 6 homolog n=1 Tax=Doryrhamphus excisus TaxID=161450 RepID=UPI0025ADA48B|nr:transport and Golgi organization protein 6 homolog [Doryrhamphus excisus]XP_057931281.1 transport and Golgi organization protein 6 homolog [Doryrhamphus excisus]XP_057931282.1 transport and Golgi organization protein 6 homolog [Doryrhamphus excisus]